MNYIEPIRSSRNQFGYRGVKRNKDCKKPFVAICSNKMIGRFETAFEAGQAYAQEVFSEEDEVKQQFDFHFEGDKNTRIYFSVREKRRSCLSNC
jgi:hypothetical protein